MEYLIGIVIGILLSVLFCLIVFKRKKSSGCFTIDLRDEAKDVCTLDLHEDINDIYRKKHILLEIRTYSDDSLN